MSDTGSVTGGDLHDLWKTTNFALPAVENVYHEATQQFAYVNADVAVTVVNAMVGESMNYGPAYPAWAALQKTLHEILYQSGSAVTASREALNSAIDEYTHVDGDNAKELNQLGEELEDRVKNPDLTHPGLVIKPSGELAPPPADQTQEG